MSEREPLAGVRGELQRLGYLSHRFERFLLQDALVPRDGWRGLPRLAGKVGLLVGSLLAAVNTLALAVANRLFDAAPADLLPLFVHLALPIVAATAIGFVVVGGLFRTVLRALPRRGLGVTRIAVALTVAALLFGGGLYFGADFLLELPRPALALASSVLLAVAAVVAKFLADALLAFGIRLTHDVPHERVVPRRWVAIAVGISAAVIGGAALLLPANPPAAAPAALPVAAGERVALVGIDGVLADELDFQLGRGTLPALARLARQNGVVAGYRRDAALSPAEFWTTVATGQAPAAHGVEALDAFRPLGLSTALARCGPWRYYFSWVAAPLGLAEQRPLLANRRRALAFWELVARGGRPVAAVNWWATYPAESVPGLIVAHGGFDLLESADPGAISPPERRVALLAARALAFEGDSTAPWAEMPATARQALERRALAPDRFHRAVAAEEAARGARAVAVYLPALDLAANGWSFGLPRFAEVEAQQLAAADALVAELSQFATTIVVVVDPGRRGGDEGRIVVARTGCAAESRPQIDPRQVAAALLRAAGLPQSRELPEPPDFCPWPEPNERVVTYGARAVSGAASATESDLYLENLRSLGYL